MTAISLFTYAFSLKMYGTASEDNFMYYLALTLMAIVVISYHWIMFASYTEGKIVSRLLNCIPRIATVKRDGTYSNVASQDLVPGDIISVREGNRIPADIRIINCNEMKVNLRLLPLEDKNLPSPQSTSLNRLECFVGTLCCEGSCEGIVLNTGDSTVIGEKINEVERAYLAKIRIAQILLVVAGSLEVILGISSRVMIWL